MASTWSQGDWNLGSWNDAASGAAINRNLSASIALGDITC
jgi:hypothetical protein